MNQHFESEFKFEGRKLVARDKKSEPVKKKATKKATKKKSS